MTNPPALRILVVDDDASFRMAVVSYLEERGYSVESSETGEDALECLRRETFDVVLLDYWLPMMSGINVLQKMHEDKNETPVVMLTGAGSEIVAVEAMSLGAYDYIPKERIEVDHLPITINSVHERHLFRKEKEARSAEGVFHTRTVETAAMMRSTLNSLAHVLNNNLSLMSLNVEDGFDSVLPQVPTSQRPQAEKMLKDLQEGIRLVSSGVNSMLTLSESVYQRLSGSVMAQQWEQTTRMQVAELENEHRRTMEESGECDVDGAGR